MLAERVKSLRQKAGFTQVDLAKAAKVSQQLITKIETGAALESRKLPQIAKALGLSVEQLLGNESTTVRDATSAYHGVQLTRAGALLAAEWEKLDVSDRAEIEGIILTRVASKKRDGRKPHKPRNLED